MLNAAEIKNGVAANVIYIDAENMALFQAQGMQLIDSAPLGLSIGDTTPDGVAFYRDGIRLPITPPTQDPAYEELLEAYNIATGGVPA